MVDPRKPLQVVSAQRFFGVALFLVVAATLIALGGVSKAQSMCHHDDMSEYWTPAYAMFVQQTESLKKWKCAWFQAVYWWTLGCQLTFLISLASAWRNGFIVRHALPLFAHGTTAGTLAASTCWVMMDQAQYYTGYARTVGLISFSGFFSLTVLQGLLGLAMAELIFAKKCAARALKVAATRDVESQRGSATSDDTPSTGSLLKESSGPLEP